MTVFFFSALPVPRTLGAFVLLLGIVSGGAGMIRHETVLLVLGAVLLSMSAYCFFAILLLMLIYHNRSLRIVVRVLTPRIRSGERAELHCASAGRFFCLPGVLARYELNVATKDGRCVQHCFDPGRAADRADQAETFLVPYRGAYYRMGDEFCLFDGFGFFRSAWLVFQDTAPHILASPQAAGEAPPVNIKPGGVEHREKAPFRRTDQLIDNRPYLPGDDPRRINWKLYGHAGDLFVREGEREPPPHSRLLVLLDTHADEGLFTRAQARRAVDMLCEKALAIMLEYHNRGMDIAVGWSGGEGIYEGGAADLITALAHPVALAMADPAPLPEPPEKCAILILALPRGVIGDSALDQFRSTQAPDIVFLYEEERLASSAASCTKLYNRRTFKA
jgi:uncharacterized protein (DUF58 family)